MHVDLVNRLDAWCLSSDLTESACSARVAMLIHRRRSSPSLPRRRLPPSVLLRHRSHLSASLHLVGLRHPSALEIWAVEALQCHHSQ